MKKAFVMLLLALLLLNGGCSSKETKKEKQPTAEQKISQLGAREIKTLKLNVPGYDRLNLEQGGIAYSVQLFQDRKISVETNFKGEVALLAPDGTELKKIKPQDKYYLPAKDGTYFVFLKNNTPPADYYIIIKGYDKARFLDDADEIPGTQVDQDGVISGVVDSVTDPVDYYNFSVNADSDLRIYYETPGIKVELVNKIGEETPCERNKVNDLYMTRMGEYYLKVTADASVIGRPYEINLKRIKNKH